MLNLSLLAASAGAWLELHLTTDIQGKLIAALLGAVLSGWINWFFKRKRLRAAIRMEVELTSGVYRTTFSAERREQLINWLAANRSSPIVILTSDRHVIIGNLTDDIGYMHPKTASRVIRFNDLSELIDDAIAFMRTREFAVLTASQKLKIVSLPFDTQDELQGLASQLLAEL